MVLHSSFACQDIVYGRKFDHGVRQAAKLGGTPEQVLEQDPVKEAWQKVTVQLAQESEERKASAQTTEDDDAEVGEDEVLASARKPAASFPLHSEGYWKAVANATVRTYVTLQPEPRSQDGVISALEQCSLKNISSTQGQDCLLVFLDMDSLGESQGPGQQALLRRKFTADLPLLRKLVQGAMLARGSQKREGGEATKVVDGDLIAIHDGFGHAGGMKDGKNMFRLSTSKKESEHDSDLKEVLVVFDDASIRNRKQRVKGSYVAHTNLLLASSTELTKCLPEKAYEHHPGHSTSNVVSKVQALSPSDLWHTNRSKFIFDV